jgi:hypothetical protein
MQFRNGCKFVPVKDVTSQTTVIAEYSDYLKEPFYFVFPRTLEQDSMLILTR